MFVLSVVIVTESGLLRKNNSNSEPVYMALANLKIIQNLIMELEQNETANTMHDMTYVFDLN